MFAFKGSGRNNLLRCGGRRWLGGAQDPKTPVPMVDGVVRWRIVDLCRWVQERWSVSYSEAGILRLFWSLDLSHRKTPPRHPQTDEKAQQAFKKGALQSA